MLKHLIFMALLIQVAYSAKKVEVTANPAPPASRSLNLFSYLLSLFGLKPTSKFLDHVYTVVKVSDGDTITIKNKTSSQLVKVRFL
jgi:hypothetical protein